MDFKNLPDEFYPTPPELIAKMLAPVIRQSCKAIDNENYRAERQKRNRELVCRIKADAEKKYDKYWYEFQVTGNSSTERTARKYEELITVCELALRGIDEECGRCRMRRKNGVEIIKSLQQRKELGEKTIGIDDVINYIDTVSAY